MIGWYTERDRERGTEQVRNWMNVGSRKWKRKRNWIAVGTVQFKMTGKVGVVRIDRTTGVDKHNDSERQRRRDEMRRDERKRTGGRLWSVV